MDKDRMNRIIAEYAKRYPPLIRIYHAMRIAGCAKATIYDWSSRGKLDHIKIPGRHLLLDRDGFVEFVLTRNENP
jgi:hypothetical protein